MPPETHPPAFLLMPPTSRLSYPPRVGAVRCEGGPSGIRPRCSKTSWRGRFPMSEAAIRLHIEPLDEGGFVATSPDVPGLVAEGRSIVEVADIARDVARKI